MHRKIKLDSNTFTASTVFDNYRVTIKDGRTTISGDLDARTPDADFEAVIHGKERIDTITAPKPIDQTITVTVPNHAYVDPEATPDVPETIEETQTVPGPERYDIGPLELDPDETPLVLAKRAKLAEIAAERWKAEVGGVMLNDMAIDTSRESQALITGAALAATLDTNYICQWKTATGFVTLDASTVIAAAQAVRAHVQGCFDREAELSAAVESAGTVEEVEAVAWDI